MPLSSGTHTRHLLIRPSASQQDRHNYYQHRHAEGEREAELDQGARQGEDPELMPEDVCSPPKFSAASRSAHYPESSAFMLTHVRGNWEWKEFLRG